MAFGAVVPSPREGLEVRRARVWMLAFLVQGEEVLAGLGKVSLRLHPSLATLTGFGVPA